MGGRRNSAGLTESFLATRWQLATAPNSCTDSKKLLESDCLLEQRNLPLKNGKLFFILEKNEYFLAGLYLEAPGTPIL